MKKTLLIAIFALSINAFAQSTASNAHPIMGSKQTLKHHKFGFRTLDPKIDSIYFWAWDTTNSSWKLNTKDVDMTHDANNNTLSETEKYWNDTSWINTNKFIYTYDANNNQTSELQQNWDSSGNWGDAFKYTYTYDSYNNQTGALFQSWSGSAWTNFRKYTYTYDANNNEIHELYQDGNGSPWTNYSQITYTYDGNNNLTNSVSQMWSGSNWVNSEQTNNTYNSGNNLTGSITQSWDGANWTDSTYSNSYVYDASNNNTSYKTQTWDGNAWVDYSLYISIYDANNLERGNSTKFFDSTGIVIDGDSIYAYYNTVTAIKQLTKQEAGITIYPNPSNAVFNLQMNNAENIQVKVYNIIGKCVYQNNCNSSNSQIDLTSQPNGVYFVSIQTKEGTVNKKIIVSH